jgi:hypothetical protein
MSAPPQQRRPPLELVPEPDPAGDTDWLTGQAAATTDLAAEQPESWQAQTVLNEWAPEHQLIGAMMWLTAEQARPILELVPDTAIWQPLRQWAYEIIRAVVADGRDPNPVVVLAAARQRSWSHAANADQPPTPYRHHRLAVYLAAAYTKVLSRRPPPATTPARSSTRHTDEPSATTESACSSSAAAAPNAN